MKLNIINGSLRASYKKDQPSGMAVIHNQNHLAS